MESALDNYQCDYGQKFVLKDIQLNFENPDSDESSGLRSQYQTAKIRFEQMYDSTKELVEEKSQIEGYSVGELAHRLLPTVFTSSNLNESLINEKIAERLDKLAVDIHEIGSRKHEILIRVISEVYDVYNQYMAKVADIDRYLKKQVITGGNVASLDCEEAPDFPDTWMHSFRKQLSDALPIDGIFKDIEREVDINEMMKKTFSNLTGRTNVEPEDLLNPKSYFDLNFNLKLDTGRNNAGSNGQTYTANALLGLARLSLIDGQNRKGIKVMPIDEAEGLGSNYDLLHKLAEKEGYQVISMSIGTVDTVEECEQNIYILSNNSSGSESYVPPIGIFSNNEYVENIDEYTQELVSEL